MSCLRQTLNCVLTITLWVLAIGSFPSTAYAQNPGGGAEFVDGEVLVAFRPNVAMAQAKALQGGIGATTVESLPALGVQRWKLPAGQSVAQAIKTMQTDPSVRYVGPNRILRTCDNTLCFMCFIT